MSGAADSSASCRRRCRIAFAGALWLAVAALNAMAQTMFRGDPAHSGVALVEVTRALPRVRWTFPTGDRIVSSPAYADGVVYVGSDDAHLYAFDLRTGQAVWQFDTAMSWVVVSPAVAGGHVYFATSDSALVHALDAASGKPVWQQHAPAYMFASPVIAGSVLPQAVLNGSLQARDRGTGELLWDFQTEASRANLGWVLTSERRFNAALLFPSNWHEATAIGAAKLAAVGSFYATPLVVGRSIYTGSADGRLYALE